MSELVHHDVKDDELIWRFLVAYLASGGATQPDERPVVSLETLEMPEETRALIQQGMVLTGAADLLSYLLGAAERDARQLSS